MAQRVSFCWSVMSRQFIPKVFQRWQQRLSLAMAGPQPSAAYCAWRQRFIQERLRLGLWGGGLFLLVLAVLIVGLIMPALNRTGQAELMVTRTDVIAVVCMEVSRLLGVALCLIFFGVQDAVVEPDSLDILGYHGRSDDHPASASHPCR